MRPKYNTLQIMRPVIETRPLRSFLNAADQLARKIMSQEDFILVDRDILGVSDDEYSATQTAVPLGRHTMYTSTLRLALLERQAPADYRGRSIIDAFGAFSRPAVPTSSHGRPRSGSSQSAMPQIELFQAALDHDVPALEENIQLQFTGLTLVNSPGHDEKGIEMALVPGNARERLLIHDEAAIVFRALERYKRSMAWLAPKTIPFVPFMRLPREVTDDQLNEFSMTLSERLPLELQLGPIEAKFDG